MIQFHDLREVSDEQLKTWLGEIADNLRPSDLLEMEATSEHPPLLTLVLSVMVSELAWVITSNGQPISVFGCGGLDTSPGEALVWMLGCPEMDDRRAAITIARMTGPYLAEMHTVYPRLWNHIDARNDKSLRWLKWSGFTLVESCPGHGLNGELFYEFERRKHHV